MRELLAGMRVVQKLLQLFAEGPHACTIELGDISRLEAEGAIGCEQLARDAADTTLMVLSFQRWYAEQAKAQVRAEPAAPKP